MDFEQRSTLESKIGQIMQVDPALQNLYINTGYRLNYSLSECFKSLFTFHNETMNIWTHLLSFIGLVIAGIIMLDYAFSDATSAERLLVITYVIGTGLCLLLSVMYHLFGCISRECHDRLLPISVTNDQVPVTSSDLQMLTYLWWACFV